MIAHPAYILALDGGLLAQLAFVLLALARTWLPLPELLLAVAGGVQDLALAVAMAALGCALRPRVLGAVGGRGLTLAAGSTLLVVLLGAPVVLAR